MTDRMAALSTLSHARRAGAAGRARRFLSRAIKDNPLVIDKWLRCRPRSRKPATLDARPGADRASGVLVGQSKPRARADRRVRDGEPDAVQPRRRRGLRLLADTVLALDPKNPQVAARLLTAFKSWRVLEPGRRAQAEAALRRVAAAPSLSRDVARHRRSARSADELDAFAESKDADANAQFIACLRFS